jgi:hypothetical protein
MSLEGTGTLLDSASLYQILFHCCCCTVLQSRLISYSGAALVLLQLGQKLQLVLQSSKQLGQSLQLVLDQSWQLEQE